MQVLTSDADATAATISARITATVRKGSRAKVDDLRAALTLIDECHDATTAEHREALNAATQATDETKRRLIRIARSPRAGETTPRMTWQEIGIALGFPDNSAKQRARALAIRLGIADT